MSYVDLIKIKIVRKFKVKESPIIFSNSNNEELTVEFDGSEYRCMVYGYDGTITKLWDKEGKSLIWENCLDLDMSTLRQI